MLKNNYDLVELLRSKISYTISITNLNFSLQASSNEPFWCKILMCISWLHNVNPTIVYSFEDNKLNMWLFRDKIMGCSPVFYSHPEVYPGICEYVSPKAHEYESWFSEKILRGAGWHSD